MYILLFQKWRNKIPVGTTWGHRPHNFLAVGAIAPIAPMDSAPMVCSWNCVIIKSVIFAFLPREA